MDGVSGKMQQSLLGPGVVKGLGERGGEGHG